MIPPFCPHLTPWRIWFCQVWLKLAKLINRNWNFYKFTDRQMVNTQNMIKWVNFFTRYRMKQSVQNIFNDHLFMKFDIFKIITYSLFQQIYTSLGLDGRQWLHCKHEFIKSEFCVTMFYCNEWNVADAYIK